VANSPPRNVEIKGQDHMLAYITPEEGGILQLLGGSGKPGPMGIPSYWTGGDEDGPGVSEAAAAAAAGTDPTGNTEGFGKDPDSVTDNNAISAQNKGSVRDTYNNKAALDTARGKTPKNPFGYKSPFWGIADLFGTTVDYSNIFGAGDLARIAQIDYNRTTNPMNVEYTAIGNKRAGYDKNQAPNSLRGGMQLGLGSLFSSKGMSTRYGPMVSQRSKDPNADLAMGLFGVLAGMSLPGLAVKGIGRDTYAPSQLANPSLDPNSPSFSGRTGLSGTVGGIADTVSMALSGNTTADLAASYDAVSGIAVDAIGALSKGLEMGANKAEDQNSTVNAVQSNSVGTVDSNNVSTVDGKTQSSTEAESFGLASLDQEKAKDAFENVDDIFDMKMENSVGTKEDKDQFTELHGRY
jgi:hypothetical protein